MKLIKIDESFVCVPQSISIYVKENLKKRSLEIFAKIGTKKALQFDHSLMVITEQEQVHAIVKNYCEVLYNLTMDELYDLLDEDNYMPTKYVKDFLKSVKTKGGTLLWQKK
jgi:hypothetical protein